MDIGEKIKRLRLKHGLTQEELAARTELSKGFISQLERNLTSPSIATLLDMLEALGTNISDFFSEQQDEKVVFGSEDMFIKEEPESGRSIRWLVTSAQKNALEPILVTLAPGGETAQDLPHEGEEFGYMLSGSVTLYLGDRKFKVKKGDSFYFKPSETHYLANTGRAEAKVLWVSSPPSF
ncbi:MAG: HTH-type transcriptional regulator PuuR [Firmicutes bacterium ADurb.Bin182]|nr:MAG: HTH-type transcriptional regulator PuuR [Firmicutes bacterium ADurb.Bin182]